MPDRWTTQGLVGLLGNYEDVDVLVTRFSSAGQLTSWFPRVLTAPSGGDLRVELNVSPGGQAGGATGLSATIADGNTSQVAATIGGIPFLSGAPIYMRVIGPSNGAGYLDGMATSDRVAATPGGDLTSVDRVKEFLKLTGTAQDGFLAIIVAGVSELFRKYTGRDFTLRNYLKVFDGTPWPDLILPQWPIANVNSVMELGVFLVGADDYQVEAERGTLIRVSGGFERSWTRAPRQIAVDWDAGYVIIPQDIQLAADRQSSHVYMQSVQSEKGRVGLKGFTNIQGGTEDYESGALLPEVIETLNQYKRAS